PPPPAPFPYTTLFRSLTVFALRGFFWLTGPEVLIFGETIHIPNGSFVIEEGCSGLHFMIVGLAVAALHGELRPSSITKEPLGMRSEEHTSELQSPSDL